MNILLAPELEQIVTRRVESGQYHSPSEVVERGLRLLEEQESSQEARLAELRRRLPSGSRRPTEARSSRLMPKN